MTKPKLSTERLLPRLTMHAGLMKAALDLGEDEELKNEVRLFVEHIDQWYHTEYGEEAKKSKGEEVPYSPEYHQLAVASTVKTLEQVLANLDLTQDYQEMILEEYKESLNIK